MFCFFKENQQLYYSYIFFSCPTLWTRDESIKERLTGLFSQNQLYLPSISVYNTEIDIQLEARTAKTAQIT